VTNLSEGTDEARQAHDAAVREQLRDLRDAPDVLLAVFRAEAEVLVQPVTNVVSVQAVRGNALTHQVGLAGCPAGMASSMTKISGPRFGLGFEKAWPWSWPWLGLGLQWP